MTTRAPPDVEAAKRLLAHAEAGRGGEDMAVAAGRVHERLTRRLSPLIGDAGMRALFARTVKLVRPEFPCFEGLVVGTEASASPAAVNDQLVACLTGLEQGVAAEACAALYGTLLALLTALIGERLVAQILRSAFPAIDENVKETKP
jgi:hypothetical protein